MKNIEWLDLEQQRDRQREQHMIDAIKQPIEKLTFETVREMTTPWAKYVHAVAVEKGWWKDGFANRNIPEVLLLVKGELIEAHEEYRKPKLTIRDVYEGVGGKPEGVPIELADAAIRVLDLMGAIESEHPSVSLISAIESEYPDAPRKFRTAENFGEALDDVMDVITRARRSYLYPEHGKEGCNLLMRALVVVLESILNLADDKQIDIGGAIITKTTYNASRPYRHGNKKA